MTSFGRRSLVVVGLLAVALGWGVQRGESAGDDAAKVDRQAAIRGLVGTWKLEKSKTPGDPSGIGKRLKMFTGTHWCVVQPDSSGRVVFVHGGTYQFDGSVLETKTDFAGSQTESFIGKSGKYTVEVAGDTMRQTDPQGVFNETWTRVK